MLFLDLESDRQKATFRSSESSSKAWGGHRLNILLSVASLEAHGLQGTCGGLCSLQFQHRKKAGTAAATSSTCLKEKQSRDCNA